MGKRSARLLSATGFVPLLRHSDGAQGARCGRRRAVCERCWSARGVRLVGAQQLKDAAEPGGTTHGPTLARAAGQRREPGQTGERGQLREADRQHSTAPSVNPASAETSEEPCPARRLGGCTPGCRMGRPQYFYGISSRIFSSEKSLTVIRLHLSSFPYVHLTMYSPGATLFLSGVFPNTFPSSLTVAGGKYFAP